MARKDFTQQQPKPRMVGEIYQIASTATASDICEFAHTKLLHLNSMLLHTCGNSAEAFQCWNDSIQDNYLWACQQMASECADLLSDLNHLILEIQEAEGTE